MKEQPHVEKLAADTILQRGVKVKIPAPFLIRKLRIKKTINLTLTSPYEGTMHRVASYYLSTGITQELLEGLTQEEALALHVRHGKAISKAIAVAILNGYWSGKIFTRWLARYLRNHLTSKEIYALLTVLLVYGGVQDFINTTKSVRKMTLTTTAPRTGQKKTQGS